MKRMVVSFLLMTMLVGRGAALSTVAAAGGGDFASGAPLVFDFKEADVLDVLRLLAEAGDFAVAADDDVGGAVTLRFTARDWGEAVAAVAAAAGLQIDRVGGVLRVRTPEGEAAAAETAGRIREAREQAAPLVVAVFELRHADAAAVVDLLEGRGSPSASKARWLSERGLLFADAGSNALFVADTQARIDRIADVVAQLDRLPTPVMIESEIVETSTDAGIALGIQWGYRGEFGSVSGDDGASHPGFEVSGDGVGESTSGIPFMAGFPVEVTPDAGSAVDLAWGALGGSQALAVRLTALEREGEARVVSRPRVVTLNNVPATIKSLTVIRVKLPSTDTVVRTDDAPGALPSAATEKIETGIVLVVTPRIVAGDRVVLDLFVKSSQADFSRQVDGIPTETSREATSRLVVGDGETVVLGGIYADVSDDRIAGVPYLRSIPGLGWLFKSKQRSDRREDLLVFITPRILGRVPVATASAEAGG
jgi:type IV pilus assembly protein PilQ